MAILLICNRNGPVRERMAFTQWAPVAAFPDGYQLGRLELDRARFMRLHIDGLNHALLAEACNAQMEDDAGTPTNRPFRRRRWRIEPGALPLAARTALADTGTAAVTRGQLRSALVRVRDGAAFAGI